MFRQHRDVRFSRDKSPYKTTTYGVVADRPSSPAPLYAQLSSGGLFAGTGYYMLDAAQLARFPEAVAADASIAEIVAAVRAAGARLEPGARGIPRSAALAHVRRVWSVCEPMNAWLDEHVGSSTS
ncbi:MAG TPA: DUF2461 family protein [Solirubrobacteraceae bacterium]|jgi:uncharacterized protein (DUF2461 family)